MSRGSCAAPHVSPLQESEAAFKVNAKAQLVQALAQLSGSPEEGLTLAKALRRRIEYVLPTLS
jgi:hypothetical protein